jgi:hypothetical protein
LEKTRVPTAGDHEHTADPLDGVIAALYAGPLDAFVARRDALAKELRAAGRRDDAKSLKALRKPKRLAWALNIASANEPSVVEAVAAAVADSVAAQAGSGDLRSSLAALRVAVRNLAAVASRMARAGEQSVEPGELAGAVMAVIGSREAFDLLRAGRLVDIPDAGGIELLSGPVPATTATSAATTRATDRRAEPESGTESPAKPDPVALEALRRTESRLAAARDRLAAAERALGETEEAAAAAERRLILAQTDAAARRKEVERAQGEAEAAAAALAGAEERLAQARKNAGAD